MYVSIILAFIEYIFPMIKGDDFFLHIFEV